MAGTLFGLGLSQQTDATGTPLSGALLYIYEENSSTPAQTFADFSLSTLQSFPIETDSAGRLPQIWVNDGAYRARLTTSAGVEVFDEASVTAIGASVGTSSGGGGSGTSVDATTVFETGDMKWRPLVGTISGWVRANGRTIGSAASGATERANSDCQSLFEYLWTNFSNTFCAVGGGRGVSAAADFNADKTIATFSMRGRGMFGLDDMGNTAAGVIVGSTAIAVGGAESITLTLANLPSTNLSIASLTGSVGTSITNGTNVARSASSNNNLTGGGGGNYIQSVSSATIALASGTVTFGGVIPLGGSGTAKSTLPPHMLGSFYIKL